MGLGPVRSQRVACATRERATLGVSARGPFGIRFGAGPCRPSRSVTRREKPGQTRSPCTLCTSRTAARRLEGDAAPILPPCDPTTHARVSPRDRGDTRPHAHHLLRHPDVRRPAVQGPAAVDGAHAGAGAVRPRRQADAPLRHLQARRHRGVHAAAPTGSRTTARRSSSGSSASAATRSTSTTATSSSTAPRSTSRTTCTREPGESTPQPTTVQGDEHRWVVAAGDLFLMGDHRANSEDSRTFGTVPETQVIGRAWLRYWPFDVFGVLADADLPGAGLTAP